MGDQVRVQDDSDLMSFPASDRVWNQHHYYSPHPWPQLYHDPLLLVHPPNDRPWPLSKKYHISALDLLRQLELHDRSHDGVIPELCPVTPAPAPEIELPEEWRGVVIVARSLFAMAVLCTHGLMGDAERRDIAFSCVCTAITGLGRLRSDPLWSPQPISIETAPDIGPYGCFEIALQQVSVAPIEVEQSYAQACILGCILLFRFPWSGV
jgi:hypothetical protein